MILLYRLFLFFIIILLGSSIVSVLTGIDDINLIKQTGMLTIFESNAGHDHDVDDDDDDDDDIVPANIVIKEGIRAVQLSVDQQKQSGVRTARLESITLQHEQQTLARVIDVQQLLDSRAGLLQIEAEKKIEQARLNNLEKRLRQLLELNRETSNISSRKIEDIQAEIHVLRQGISAFDLRLENQKRQMSHKWGNKLAGILLNPESELLRRLVENEEVILLLSLKSDQSLKSNIGFIYVNRSTDRLNARKAYILSEAPSVDPVLQGETYYLRTNARGLRVGMRLHAWIESEGRPRSGVVVPKAAVLLHSGQYWVYQKVDDDAFARIVLNNPVDTGSGILIEDNLQPGDEVVTSGAQTLLSEEHRLQIPDEDDD